LYLADKFRAALFMDDYTYMIDSTDLHISYSRCSLRIPSSRAPQPNGLPGSSYVRS
jgi:hypothetical protein